jgi:hypothetical protein
VQAGIRKALGAIAAVVFTAACAHAAESPAAAALESLPTDTRTLLQWVQHSGDAHGRPYAVVDKRAARIWVFDAAGRLAGSAPALLGQATGDDSAPGVGQRVTTGIAAHERTTPAGRFVSEPGRNDKGEAIVWVDYEAAVAIHRLRPAPAGERRPQRLASASPADKRISLGCVVVSEAFYDTVVAPTLGRRAGIVYVLPETRPLQAVFGAIEATASM